MAVRILLSFFVLLFLFVCDVFVYFVLHWSVVKIAELDYIWHSFLTDFHLYKHTKQTCLYCTKAEWNRRKKEEK